MGEMKGRGFGWGRARSLSTANKKQKRKGKEQMKRLTCALGMLRNILSHHTGLELHHSGN
jgi:hypothetical protein